MNQIEHQLTFRSPFGDLLDIITDGAYLGLTYALDEDQPGVLDLTLPGDYDRSLLMIDGTLEVRRIVDGTTLSLEGETAFFIRKVSKEEIESGGTIIKVTAFSAKSILQRRIVAYYAGTSYSDKYNVPWDDMLRDIVRENYGAGASFAGASYSGPFIDGDAARNIEPWLTTEPNQAMGWGEYHSMPWNVVMDALEEIANVVRNSFVFCSYDIVWISPAHYEFKVFVGLRGIDHRMGYGNPVIVSKERLNLSTPYHDDDWQEEKNYVYATGQGLETNRTVKTDQDNKRITISPFNRQEFQQEARQTSLDDSVQAVAFAAIEAHRPKKSFTGSIQQTEGCVYGVNWGWGDLVTAEYDGEVFDCHVSTITVSVGPNGTETVTGKLKAVNDVD